MPSFSPDGRRIAFTRVEPSAATPGAGLFTVDRSGRHVRPLLSDRIDLSADWSPDGRRIAFSSGFSVRRQGHPRWLMVMPSFGGLVKRVGRFAGVLDPAWSPASVR